MNKTRLILLTLLTASGLMAQYNYGLEICEQDLRVEGRIDIDDGNNNVHIGRNTGINDTADGNVFVGNAAGLNSSSGSSNTFIGTSAGSDNISGGVNTFIGTGAGGRNINGSQNVYIGEGASLSNNGGSNVIIGFRAGLPPSLNSVSYSSNVFIGSSSGRNNDGSSNVFIGSSSGFDASGSNLLYIENSNSNSPLVYGEFDNDRVEINGSLHIRDAFQLIPQTPPNGSCTDNGEMVYGTDNELYLCKGGIWKKVMTN